MGRQIINASSPVCGLRCASSFAKQQTLYLLPLPHGHKALRDVVTFGILHVVWLLAPRTARYVAKFNSGLVLKRVQAA
ncbi:MAG TPA: hypothetical protein VJP85_00220 [Candidatus Baltobacteraceae bacterium]|nr:hypothetical protein [Candidatus Baltobacteraceae bacterium]